MNKGQKKNIKKRTPITRSNKFFSGEDFRLDVEIGREYFTDLGMTISLFKVNYKKTKTHDLYGESKAFEKIVNPPIELRVRLEIEAGETKYLAPGGLKKEFAGNLNFTVYENELEEKNITIQEGDFVGYNDGGRMRYWEVYNAEQINVSNARTMGGKDSYYRIIKCSPTESDVFNG